MTRLLIVDDHAVVREGLRRIVEDDPCIDVAAEAPTGEEALDLIKSDDFDVVLLDISLPGVGGLEVLRRIKDRRPKLPVLMLSIHDEEAYAIRTLKMGASGYMTKNSAPEELVAALQIVARGGRYVSPSFAGRLADIMSGDVEDEPFDTLSDRECQVMVKLAEGASVSEIAGELYLSPKTITTYRTRILTKMDMKNNAQLAAYAVRHGILS